MSTELEFKEMVKSHLEKLSDDLEIVLKKLINHGYPEEVDSISFEVFSDGFTDGFPVQAYFMDSDNSEHFIYVNGEAEYPSPVGPGLLEIDNVYPYELEEKFTEKDDELNFWEIASENFVEWFSECWSAAGGGKFGLKANIGSHDGDKEFDLINRQWVEQL